MTIASRARTRGWRLLVRATSLLVLVPALARAAEPCSARPLEASVVGRWPAPLDRLVTLHARDLALRDALDRLAAAARLRLSYTAELIMLDRRVCVSYDSVAAGVVLSDLLIGSAVTPVVAGDDQVVLAPSTAPRRSERRADRGVNMLDRVVVTGSALGTSQRGLAVDAVVIDRAQLARQSGGTLSQTLNGIVPGVWMWDQSPSSLTAQFGSLRGASSFQVSYPKVYIDGVEVANPLLLTELSPDAVERIEVIRGPQGAALYGADAIGGVINVVMRHDGAGEGDRAQLRGTAGLAQSAFASRPVLVQEHTLALRGGEDLRSSALSVTLGSVGSYAPGAQSRDVRGDGGFRIVGTRSMLTGTARFYAKDAGTGTSPLVASPSMPEFGQWASNHDQWHAGGRHDFSQGAMPADAGATSQSVREYTLGTTATFSPDRHWTHALTLGIDGYRLSGDATTALTPVPSAIDSALRAARGGADRATLRASSVAQFGSTDGAAATMTFAAEHSSLQQHAVGDGLYPLGGRNTQYSGWQSNTGVVSQLDASWRGALFATGGLRVERNQGLAAADGLETLPMIGGAAVHDFGPLTTKLRASYGKGIRPAGSAIRASWIERPAVVQGRLAPEEQSGFESGVDAFIGRAFALHVTRFDQHAFGLIQPVKVVSTLMPFPNDGSTGRELYVLQNVGEISNRGWELESSVSAGQLSLIGTISLVESRVRQLALDYEGDLRAGDRMLGVPARTGGLTASWLAPRWSASITTTRATDWLNYDGLALAAAATTGPIVGQQLRQYWRSYPGVTRIDASATRRVFGGLTFVRTGRNLLDVQRGEPDNITVVPGRTITAGVQAKF